MEQWLTRFVDRLAVPVLPLPGIAEVAIARFLDTLRDPIHRPVEVPLFPLGCVRSPILDLRQAVRVHRELERGRALGAERAAVDRAVRVPLDVDDLALPYADDLGTADRAVRANAGDFTSPLDLELGGGRLHRLQVEPQPGESADAGRHAGSAEELTTVGLGELIAHDPLEIQDQPNSIAPGIAALHTGLYRGSCPFATPHAERANVSPVSPGAPPNSLKLK